MGSFVQLLTVANVAALTALDGTTSPRRAANVVIWVINDGAGTPAEYMFADGAGSGTVEADDSAGYWNRLESSVVADGAITTAKIASDAVTTAKITNNAVTLAKIATQADNTITANLSGGVASPSAVAVQAFVASLLQAANVTAAQQSLDLETGVDVQAYSAILAALVSGYGAATSGDVFKKDGSNGAWAADSGSTVFTGLTDTPVNYTSSGGYAVRVNSGATALEFAAFNAALVGLGNVPNTDATDAANISSGTLPDARLSSAVTTSLGLADTGLQPGDQLDADDVTTGTLPNARLDAVPLTALATQVDNTILANFSGGTAVPSAVAVAAHIETFLESADEAAARTAIGISGSGQRLSTTKTDVFVTTTTSTWIDVTGLSLTITPSTASKKIRILAVLKGGCNNVGFARVVRGSTPLGVGDAAGTRIQSGTTDFYDFYAKSDKVIGWIDSPATMSATTYKIQVFLPAAGTLRLGAPGYSDSDSALVGRFAQFFELEEID